MRPEQDSSRLEPYLAGLSFPASKVDAIAVVEANGVPQDMLERVQRLDCERFETPEELLADLL